MNEDNIANKRLKANIFDQTAKRNSLPDNKYTPVIMRWPRPTRVRNIKNDVVAKSSEPSTNGVDNTRDAVQRQSNQSCPDHSNQNSNVVICQPTPIKVENIDEQSSNYDYPKSWDINSRLNRQQRFNENIDKDSFTQELEDRIEADLEVETLFQVIQQTRSLSLGKTLPERPSNPIINDKYFLKGDTGNSTASKEKLLSTSQKQIPFFRYRECSIQRQRRILQEDFEAQNEIHQLLSPTLKLQNQSSFTGSMSSSSELSSFESEVSRFFGDEISQEN